MWIPIKFLNCQVANGLRVCKTKKQITVNNTPFLKQTFSFLIGSQPVIGIQMHEANVTRHATQALTHSLTHSLMI